MRKFQLVLNLLTFAQAIGSILAAMSLILLFFIRWWAFGLLLGLIITATAFQAEDELIKIKGEK